MKRIVMSALGVALMGWPVSGSVNAAVSEPVVGVYVANTQIANNTGLAFCQPSTEKGCIDSISVDGVRLTPVQNPNEARYQISGGLYSGPCKFVDTTVTQCEYPYMVIFPRSMSINAPIPMTNVEVNFRRSMKKHPTSAVNAVIVNGSLQSFVPAAPGVRDIATINANSSEIHAASSGLCLGWVLAVDTCTVGDVAQSSATNRVSMLLLPAMRSSIVPPDAADAECKRINPTNDCFVYIFDAKSQGGWVDTNASIFGLTSTDRFTGAAQLKIAGPHFKAAVNGVNDLNLANFRMYLPSAYLMNSFGLTPDQANAVTLPVKRTARDGSTVPVTEYIPRADGLLVSTTGIGFSIPTMTVQRILVVKRNQTLSANSLLKAAGVFQTRSLGPAKITVNAPHGMRFNGKRYSFTRTRNVRVTIQYQSSKKSKSVRYLTVKVVK
jgi:hypothetical protein